MYVQALGSTKPCAVEIFIQRSVPDYWQGNYDEADPLFLRAIDIHEKALGPDHPQLGQPLNDRALLLKTQVRVEGKVQEFFRSRTLLL